jgi:hypothetical protein
MKCMVAALEMALVQNCNSVLWGSSVTILNLFFFFLGVLGMHLEIAFWTKTI